MSEYILELKDVVKTFGGVKALNGVHCQIITKRQRKIYKPRKCLYFLGFSYICKIVRHHKKTRIFYGN